MGFFKKREKAAPSGDFDRENEKPIIKASICNGEQIAGFKNIHTGVRFASYLNVPATGNYRKLECASGHMSFEEMKAHKGLYVVNFSDFQMNAMNGYYGGEIRLAYLNDGTKITPVTGGSINGNIYDAQKEFIFSKEMQDTAAFKGPKAMLIKNVSVAGK